MGRKPVDRRDDLEDWLREEQRRHLERLLAPAGTTASNIGSMASPIVGPSQQPVAATRAAWLLAVGACAVSFGIVLVSWGWCAERIDLWRVGLPAALIGQVLLWIGFRVRPRGATVMPVLADAAARTDYSKISAVSATALPVFPPLPPLAAMTGKHSQRV